MKKGQSITSRVRELRQLATPEEDILWQYLRNRQLDGFKFRRQHPIVYHTNMDNWKSFFVADFYCAAAKLVLELDGKIHENQKERDRIRDGIINEQGIKVLRIKNEELQNMKAVLDKIRAQLPHP